MRQSVHFLGSFLDFCEADVNVFQIDVGGVLEGINLANRCFDFISKFVGPYTLKNLVVFVGKDDIPLRIEF